MTISLRFYLNSGQVVSKYYSAVGRRFISSAVPNIFLKGHVLVSYGKRLCSHGCLCEFDNQGWYTNKLDFLKATRDFLEEGQRGG